MTIHYQELKHRGMRAAYLARPEGDVDRVVRAALHIQHVEPRDGTDIAHDEIRQSYIIEGKFATIYHSTHTPLQETTYTVQVPKGEGNVTVGICSRIPMPQQMLEVMIKTVLIDGELVPAGLVPIESTRD